MPPWARGSALGRILACQASAVGVMAHGPNTTSDAAAWGTGMHTVKETGIIPPDFTSNRPFGERAALMNRTKWWPDGFGRHEVTYSLNVLAWSLDVYDGPRAGADAWKLSRDDACVTGTADWVGDLMGRVHVDDLKTGKHLPETDGAPMLFYGTCALIEAGQTTSDEPALSITHFTRYPKPSPAVRYWAEPTVGQLEEFKGALQAAHQTVLRMQHKTYRIRNRDTNPGPDACAFCPAKIACYQLKD